MAKVTTKNIYTRESWRERPVLPFWNFKAILYEKAVFLTIFCVFSTFQNFGSLNLFSKNFFSGSDFRARKYKNLWFHRLLLPSGPLYGDFLFGRYHGWKIGTLAWICTLWWEVHFLRFYTPLRYILNVWFVFKVPLTAHQITLEMADSFLCTKFESGLRVNHL